VGGVASAHALLPVADRGIVKDNQNLFDLGVQVTFGTRQLEHAFGVTKAACLHPRPFLELVPGAK